MDKFYVDVEWEKEEEGIGRKNLNVGNLSASNVLVEG